MNPPSDQSIHQHLPSPPASHQKQEQEQNEKSETQVNSSDSKSCSYGRFFLSIFAVLMIIVMAIGIVFVAQRAYHDLGGQGFLTSREESDNSNSVPAPDIYLPLRMVENDLKELHLRLGFGKRSPGDVPFYACGDQQQSCGAYNQPDICCPIEMICLPTDFTNSNIFCCNSTAEACQASVLYAPKCLPSTIQCSAATGGGCCPSDLICSPNGCIRIEGPSIIGPSSTATDSPVTVYESPASTATVVKEGEVAQQGTGTKRSVVLTLCVPYSSAWILVCIAALMGML